jgi:hypothetical protein
MSENKTCCICSSNKHVDDHHYDCLYGMLSPETVPLCRRCHQTYHIWGIGSFSPDTTEKALEVENKRREILRSLEHGHPQRRRAEYLGELSPLKLEDVRRSGYWYKKWHITPPSRSERKKPSRGIKVRIPREPSLCGEGWLQEHLNDHTPEEIGTLVIEIASNDRWLPPVSVADKRGKVKAVVRSLSNG